MKKVLFLLLLMVTPFCGGNAQVKQTEIGTQEIYVSFDKVKHIILPAQVSDINLGRLDYVNAERVEAAPYIVRLTAQEENYEGSTNLTIVCTDGSVHSFRIRYLPKGMTDENDNIIYVDNDKLEFANYKVLVNSSYETDMFFPSDILYCKQGNEAVFAVEYYNNIIKVYCNSDSIPQSNLFVVDRDLNCYEITLNQGDAASYSYNFDNDRKYIAHIDVNSFEMNNFISKLRVKKRNIFSVGVIKNKFEMSLANLYVYQDYMFFVFDIKNFSNIDYDIDFLKCFQRDQKKMKNAIQQEIEINPVYLKDFSSKITGKSENRFILAFRKFTIPDSKIFEIEMFEKEGGRHMQLSILNEYILSAQLLK